MTPQAQRVAIAQACGWTNVRFIKNPDSVNDCLGIPPTLPGSPSVPDYLNDLNAMNEAELWMRGGPDGVYHTIPKHHQQWAMYKCLLKNNIAATAAQRAEAFLRTLDLWVEEEQQETK